MDVFPLALSLRVATVALVIALPIGLALAWLQARRTYRFKALVDALILLPLVLPPSVTGFGLLVAFGQQGPLGRLLHQLGVKIVFTEAGAVVAATVVALPLLVKTAQPALEAVPEDWEDVGRSLGLSDWRVFWRVTVPAAWRGILAATLLAYARALGEFGATLLFAGNIPGRTNTMPLEIYAAWQAGDDGRAFVFAGALSLVSLAVVAVATRFSPLRGLR